MAAFGVQLPSRAANFAAPAKTGPSARIVTEIKRNRFSFPAKDRTRVALLQGPVGPFFRHLKTFLDANGCEAWRISLNAGDRLFSGRSNLVSYPGGEEGWESWFRDFIEEGRFDHVVLFGAERRAHSTARRVAEASGVDVISLEEGYIRPGFVAVEKGANNRLSPVAGLLPPPDFMPMPSMSVPDYGTASFRSMCHYGAAYYLAGTLFSQAGQRELFHRRVQLASEGLSWTRNLYRRVARQSENVAVVERLLEHHVGRYYIVPLQVCEDTQMGPAAMGWDNSRLIRETLKSFAASAPKSRRLVFKIHPFERGRDRDRILIQQISGELDVEGRVDVIDVGSIGHLTRHSAGMITINSTSGLSAIFHGVPLMVIGEAIYANRHLANCARGEPDFAAFWKGGHVADEQLRHRYIAWIKEACLHPGDFYTLEGMDLACQAVLASLRSPAVLSQGSVKAA